MNSIAAKVDSKRTTSHTGSSQSADMLKEKVTSTPQPASSSVNVTDSYYKVSVWWLLHIQKCCCSSIMAII